MEESGDFIAREVQALKQLRRISTSQGGPGALTLDPDLPPTTSPSSTLSPQAAYWTGVASTSPVDDSSTSDGSIDDTTHLFWVPAHLHPELAPGEFRAFLKEHARTVPEDATSDSASTLDRANSGGSSTGLSRRKSMLSRQYQPAIGDGIEHEKVVQTRSNRRRSLYNGNVPVLTIRDIQKLEELAEEAAKTDDPSTLRTVLRRSLSLNTPPSLVDRIDDIQDDTDAPIIVPLPGQILRRAVRTKIRKPGLPGDGGGHRFPASRRAQARSQTIDGSTRPPSDASSLSDYGDEPYFRPHAPTGDYDEDDSRPVSFSEESMIFDAYTRPESLTEDEFAIPPVPPLDMTLHPKPPLPEAESEELPRSNSPPRPSTSRGPPSPPAPVPPPTLYQPAPVHHLDIPGTSGSGPTRSTSPGSIVSPPSSPDNLSQQGPVILPPAEPSTPPRKKGGLFSSWGSKEDKSTTGNKAAKLGKNRDKNADKDREKEKESGGFLSSLFGRRKPDEQPSLLSTGVGPATAASLLGPSKSKEVTPQPDGYYARYPIHVERAVYRLSHIKLANPRRPLYEQVLISNLMFWYLGVINKAQSPTPSPTPPSQQQSTAAQEQAEKERLEKEQKERERAEKERLEREKMEKERLEKESKNSRRKSLTKERPGSVGRRAEMPVRGPQYDVQSRIIEEQYAASPPRPGSAPPQAMVAYHLPQRAQQPPPTLNQQFYYAPPETYTTHQPPLPPGAMAPVSYDNWKSPTGSMKLKPGEGAPPRKKSPPPPKRREGLTQDGSVPPLPTSSQPRSVSNPTGSRPLSADNDNQSGNGRLRKLHSASASIPDGRRVELGRRKSLDGHGGEEDMPLAMLQQQQQQWTAQR